MEMETADWLRMVLTTASILLTALGLVYSWQKDTELRRRDLADKIRAEAAKVLGALERWKEASMLLFIEIQPKIVLVVDKLFETKNANVARDLLWKEITEVRFSAKKTIFGENVTTAYTGLYKYCPQIREAFVETVKDLTLSENEDYRQLLKLTEDDIYSFSTEEQHEEGTPFTLKKCTSAEVGNKLRETVYNVGRKTEVNLDVILNPIIKDLKSIIVKKDDVLLDSNIHDSSFSCDGKYQRLIDQKEADKNRLIDQKEADKNRIMENELEKEVARWVLAQGEGTEKGEKEADTRREKDREIEESTQMAKLRYVAVAEGLTEEEVARWRLAQGEGTGKELEGFNHRIVMHQKCLEKMREGERRRNAV